MLGLLLAAGMWLEAVAAPGTGVRVSVLPGGPAPGDIAAVRDADGWTPTGDTLRRRDDARWWRVDVDAGPAPTPGDWIVSIREAYDARLVAYAPPDYRPRPLATFDPAVQQLGSRQRLTITVPADALGAPVFIEQLSARQQPMQVAAAPLATYLEADYARVRFSSAILSTQLLLAVVAIVFAVALRRWSLLLFFVWVLSVALYQVVMRGEVVPLATWIPPEQAMSVAAMGISLGLLAAYAFMFLLLQIPQRYPRLARAYRLALLTCATLLVLIPFTPVLTSIPNLINVLLLLLGVTALGVGVARAFDGDRESWFFLVGWGLVSVVSMLRTVYFMQHAGTPVWLEYLHPASDAFGALVLVLATARAARYAEREMVSARQSAMTDTLTGLPNRAQLDVGAAQLLRTAADRAYPLAVLFVDLDHFKQVNDRFGHDVGDACLQAMAASLRRHVRSSDLVARYGGEEFVVLLQGADTEAALRMSEALRAAVETEGRVVDGRPVGLTASIGVATRRPGDDVAQLFKRADAALYRAKHGGRNRIVLGDDTPLFPGMEPA